jgi:hypothetical protein
MLLRGKRLVPSLPKSAARELEQWLRRAAEQSKKLKEEEAKRCHQGASTSIR